MILACLEFEEVKCAEQSLGIYHVDYKPQLQRHEEVDTRCFEVLQDGDQYMSQDTCLQTRIVDDEDISETLFSSASICKATSTPERPLCLRNAMEEMLQAELEGWQHRPFVDCLAHQEITAGDRASAVDNVTRTATQLQLSSDVLFLSMACLDRCLSVMRIQPALLDTAALACLWVAAKYEHCVVPSAVNFLASAQADFTSAASRQLLVDMEARVLQALDYRISIYPTTKTFLPTIFTMQQQMLRHKLHAEEAKKQTAGSSSRTGAAAGHIDPRLYFCASYLAEMSLLECKLVHSRPARLQQLHTPQPTCWWGVPCTMHSWCS